MIGAGQPVADAKRAAAPVRVLFVCTGNSVRSIMAEAVMRQQGNDRFVVSSAGTHPSGVHPLALRVLGEAGVPVDDLRSKSTDEFLDQPFDFVITLCDDARQVCPTFPGVHETLHWGYDDPSLVAGEDARAAAFRRTLTLIGERVRQFIAVMTRA